MASDLSAMLFTSLILAIILFFIWSFWLKRRSLIHKFYLLFSGGYALLVLALLAMKFSPHNSIAWQFVWDACTNSFGAFLPVLYLCISLAFARGWAHMPRWGYALFMIPVVSNLVVWTNPLHHLQYQVFSVVKSELVFGPYAMVSGIYSYLCLIAGIAVVVRFAIRSHRNHSRLYLKQCLLIITGGLCPLVVSLVATLGTDMPITATPLSFIPTIICNGVAIYLLHLLDIQPIATQRVLDWITDCYLVLTDKCLVVSYNHPFADMFASRYGIAENHYLQECIKEEDIANKTAVYNLMSAIESCRESRSTISYEQAVTVEIAGSAQKNYYITDVSPLISHQKLSGFVVIFKDVTLLKKSMQQLQDSQTRMMEQERLAFLGQMMGGLAHNLKTPIMSISGCLSAAEALVDEAEESLEDPQVVSDDYREIYQEIREWFQKARDASAYMSDIISAIKGQAATVSANQEATFTIDELMKRTMLLMRHELHSSGCTLALDYDKNKDLSLQGDVNNLVQVLVNLLSNAIDAQRQTGGGEITVGVHEGSENLDIYVRDTGPGVSENVRSRLFKEMVTSKGLHGSGLGLYISNVVVKGKFGGSMWQENNPGGGSVFGISIPIDSAVVTQTTNRKEVGSHEKK